MRVYKNNPIFLENMFRLCCIGPKTVLVVLTLLCDMTMLYTLFWIVQGGQQRGSAKLI